MFTSRPTVLRKMRAVSDQRKWILRAVGAGLMWLGIGLGLSWIPALTSKLPLLGGLAGSLAGTAIGLLSFAGATCAASIVVAAAWARFRPFHSAALAISAFAAYYAMAKAALSMNQGQHLGQPRGHPSPRIASRPKA